jgi:hypothetical protein
MSEQRKQRPFQFHLATVMVAVLVMGGQLGLSLHRSKEVQLFGYILTVETRPVYGWPFIAYDYSDNVWTDIGEQGQYYWRPFSLAADIVCCVAQLSAATFVTEWVIRRKGRKQ